jgi:flavin-dependent dehydrogenase
MAPADQRDDVLILGGGPAGLITAFHIVKGGGSAVVVERGRYDKIRIGEHLPPEGVTLMRSAGVSGLDDNVHVRCAGVTAWWGSDTPHYMDYLFHPAGYGLNLSRPHFDSCLAEQCRRAGVQLLTGARLINVARSYRGWRAEVQCGNDTLEFRPRFVVDATGRSAAFARSQGSFIEARDSQVALIAFRASNPAVDTTSDRIVIESAQHGWWYFAPLSDGRCVCMFMTDANLLSAAPGSALANWDAWLRRTQRMHSRVEEYPALTRFVVCTARSQRLDRMSGRGWIAVGDAAIVFDPLSSHGIAKGVEHGWRTADAVLACLDGDNRAVEELSDRFAVEFADYEQTRRAYYSIECRWPDTPFWRQRATQHRLR